MYPNLGIRGPVIWVIDRLDDVRFRGFAQLGPFSEVVVLRQNALFAVDGSLTVGCNVIIGAQANIRAAGGSIEIEDECIIAQGVSIIAGNHSVRSGMLYREAPSDPNRRNVHISRNCWIGAGAILLPGTTIGNNTIIAAGAVVRGSVPPDEIWGGVPAKFIKKLHPNEGSPDLSK
jgi:acetyltransferase-like isoleucine patch superfamily enzyme